MKENIMGSHNSSSTWQKLLNSGSLKRYWQDLLPFESLEFYKQISSKWLSKWWIFFSLLVITKPFIKRFGSHLNRMCKIRCLNIITKNLQNGG